MDKRQAEPESFLVKGWIHGQYTGCRLSVQMNYSNVYNRMFYKPEHPGPALFVSSVSHH